MKVGRIDLVVTQYWKVIFQASDDDASKIPCRNKTLTQGLCCLGWWGKLVAPPSRRSRLEQRNWGKDAAAERSHPILPQIIRAITNRRCVNKYFYNSGADFHCFHHPSGCYQCLLHL